jgi:hypothetical protein
VTVGVDQAAVTQLGPTPHADPGVENLPALGKPSPEGAVHCRLTGEALLEDAVLVGGGGWSRATPAESRIPPQTLIVVTMDESHRP